MGYFWCSHSSPVRDCRACRKKLERRGYDFSSSATYDPALQTVWFTTDPGSNSGSDHGHSSFGGFGGDSGGSCGGDGGGGGGCD